MTAAGRLARGRLARGRLASGRLASALLAAALLAVAPLSLAACSGDDADATGADLARDFGCLVCHTETGSDLAPTLKGLWGSKVALSDGTTVTADADYVRRSIVNPPADVVAGWEANMPFFPVDEDQVDLLVEYVRSLG